MTPVRITGTGPLSDPRRNAASKRRASGSFSLGDATPATLQRPTSAPAPVTGLDSLLAVQAVESSPDRVEKSVARAHRTLDALEEVRLATLAGVSADLAALKALVRDRQTSADPALDAVTDAIDLRARVELAKRGVTDL